MVAQAGEVNAAAARARSKSARLGPIELMPGVTRVNAITKLFASSTTIAALTGMAILQGYILTEHLEIPRRAQGTISGDLSFWTEIVMLLVFVPCGILADRYGRRPVYVAGVLLVGLGWGLYPFATSVPELTFYRMIFAVGVAATTSTLSTLVNDYPTDRSRGKYIGITGMLNVVGTIFAARAIGAIPEQVTLRGYDAVTGGTVMFGTMALICVLTAVVAQWGLKAGTPVKKRDRLPVRELYKSGLRAARNRRIALSYAAAMAARSDVVIKGLFLSLWAIQSGREMGFSTGESMTKFGTVIALMYIVSFCSSPLFGWFIDKVDRMTAMCVALVTASAGYLSMAMVSSPLESSMIPYLILLTLGTGWMVKAQMALIGQEAPVKERGSVISTAQVFGAIGILIFTAIGGRVFDAWGPAAPFVIVGAYQSVLLVAALAIRVTTERADFSTQAAAPGRA
ncbi:MAG: MFS transporter [Gammaproteobacteria bacterium]|jgi:MFS family permease|nr:MFS transporter [Gammaproteobacteria bacterium]